MKNILIIIAFFLPLAAVMAQVDSSFFQNIGGSWYQINASYDAEGKLLNRNIAIVGQTGDSLEVAQLSLNGQINEASSWAATQANAIRGFSLVRQIITSYSQLYGQVTGLNTVIEKCKVLAPNFLPNGDTVTVRLFILGQNLGKHYLFQLNNGRLRLQSVDNPATFYNVNLWSANSFQVLNLPAGDDALAKAQLTALKAAKPELTVNIDACIAGLSAGLSNPVLVYIGNVRRQDGRELPTFESTLGRVRMVVIE